jgi:hypothetical protein
MRGLQEEVRGATQKRGQQIAAALKEVERKGDGIIEATAVVSAAKPIHSPLHNCFEWDDTKCGEEYRLYQARNLIRTVTVSPAWKEIDRRSRTKGVKVEQVDVRVRAYHSVRPIAGEQRFKTRAYMPVDEMPPAYYQQVVDQAWADLKVWRRKYQHLKEFKELMATINELWPK